MDVLVNFYVCVTVFAAVFVEVGLFTRTVGPRRSPNSRDFG